MLTVVALCLVSTYGPVTQGDFLLNLGIEERLDLLLKKASEKQAEGLIKSYERLVDPAQMGSVYKVLGFGSGLSAKPEGFELSQT